MTRPLPPPVLAGALGAVGFAAAWQACELALLGGRVLGPVLGWAALGVLTAIVARLAWPRPSLDAELAALAHEPRLLPFLAALGLAAILAPAILPGAPVLFAVALWAIGAGVLSYCAVRMALAFLKTEARRTLMTPASLIPFAGLLAAPVAGAPLGLPLAALILYAAGAAGAFAVLLPLVQRLVRAPDNAQNDSQTPLLMILISPPALGYLGLAAASQNPLLPGALVNLMLAAAVFIGVAPLLVRAMPSIFWFAAAFPSATLANAIATAAHAGGHQALAWGALLPLGLAALALTIGARAAWPLLKPGTQRA